MKSVVERDWREMFQLYAFNPLNKEGETCCWVVTIKYRHIAIGWLGIFTVLVIGGKYKLYKVNYEYCVRLQFNLDVLERLNCFNERIDRIVRAVALDLLQLFKEIVGTLAVFFWNKSQ